MTSIQSNEDEQKSGNPIGLASSAAKAHAMSLSALGDACGVAFLLGNHAKFGLAERCCYHFDLIETLTSLPTERARNTRARGRDPGGSVSSEGRESNITGNKSPTTHLHVASSSDSSKFCSCGVVSLLECVPSTAGDSRPSKRALRSKHREFNTRAQKSWGRAHRGSIVSKKHNPGEHGSSSGARYCHQPRHLPLPLNPSTRVTFAYEITSIAIVVDASPSITTATFGNESFASTDELFIPLDKLAPMLKVYLKGLVQPIEVPPVFCTGVGVALGRWTPNLAITVVAAYPPTPRGDRLSAGLLVRDYRVTDEQSAIELVRNIERWALTDVEGTIADRLSGQKSHIGDGLGGRKSQGGSSQFSPVPISKISAWTSVRSSMKDLLAVGDAALATLPQEGRPTILVASDCLNVNCGGVFDHLAETSRSDVPVSVLNLSNVAPSSNVIASHASFPLSVSDDSKPLRDACNQSGGIFLDVNVLDFYVAITAGSPLATSPSYLDSHFVSKRRSIRPNALQWYSLFSLSPLTPGYVSQPLPRPNLLSSSTSSAFFSSTGSVSSKQHRVQDSLSTFGGITKLSSNQSFETSKPLGNMEVSFSTHAALSERTVFSKYNINPVRIKSLLMTRILEGYRARKYGSNTQDPDKVSIHMTLKLTDVGVVLHYEVSFVSSPYHVPMIGTAHIKLELSGDDKDFIALVKKTFITQDSSIQGRPVSAISKAAAERICKLLRWIRKEDYLDSYLCLPGWGDIDHFAKGSSFLRRMETLTMLQRHRHFRSEVMEVVAVKGSKHENHDRNYALFSDLMETHEGEENLFDAISDWSTGLIDENKMYYKVVFPAKDDNLTYYLIIYVTRCQEASRLFKISIDFHGELDAEQRLGVLASFQDKLKMYSNVVVLSKNISGIIALRPESRISTWPPKHIGEYFLHHKSWDIVRDTEVLPLITRRRNQVGNFITIHSEDNRAVFAKYAQNGDVVVYQVLDRQDGVYVDIHMECERTSFNPFYNTASTFYGIYEKVKRKDMACAKNLVSRTNLLKALDHRIGYESTDDILRLINISSQVDRQLRFFHDTTANDLLFDLTSDFITSGLLNTQTAKLLSQATVGDFCGDWFIMRVDWYVVSAILFSTKLMEDGNSSPYKQLILFTSGITDLYPTDDDTTNSAAAHEDDPYGLDLVVNEIEQAHSKNYATALYQALRNQNSPISSVQSEDVAYALRSCFFKIVLREFISLDDLSDQLSPEAETMTGIKLYELIGTLLSPLPGSDDQLFYFNGNEILDNDHSGEGSLEQTDLRSLNSHDLDDTNLRCSDHSRVSRHSNDGESDAQSHGGDSAPADEHPSTDLSPLFFRISFDGKIASQHHIRALKSSTILEAQVTVFNNKRHLPPMHQSVISRLRKVLNSFAVEQSLEKYRYCGDSLSEDDFKDIITILPQTKHHSFNIPLNFYVSKCNCLVSASNPTGSTENDLDHAYSKLYTELESCASRSSNNSFLIMKEHVPFKVFPFWCFAHVNRQSGIITITVYHPSGDEAASAVGEETCELVNRICHKTNQLLLLENLHRTKSASVLLIVEEQTSMMDDDSREAGCVQETKQDSNAIFSCPVQYQKLMALNHRCAPRQAIDSLSTTLQNFLLSNRRGIFVYKDESENIFYMKLIEHQHSIELCVFGLSHPGPSITKQLVCLLQKNILSLGLNAISSLLTKNQYYNLLPADVSFLRDFSDHMGKLDADNTDIVAKSRRVTYALPSHIRDPLVILLLFRRNITGSTFIHHLHEATEDTSAMISDVLNEREDGGMTLRIPRSEFTFIFNSSPSQLDPNYQALSTLTERGRQFSREAGSGIAIIEISLSSNNTITILDTREETNQRMSISKSDVSLQRMQENETSSSFKITVDITNTTVDIDILHKWVELSLSQVLVAWCIETHMRISQSTANHSSCEIKQESCTPLQKNQRLSLWSALPSLPAFDDMMRLAVGLPHPACFWTKRAKMIRTASLASLTLQTTEMIMSLLYQKARLNSLPGVKIVRCADKAASVVNIRRNSKSKNSVGIELSNGKKIKDKAMENPEYICVFGLESYDPSLISTSQLFFKETPCERPTQETSIFSKASSCALTAIKNKWPLLFTRHLAFILRVSKSSRTLICYNMHPHLWNNIMAKFSDIDQEVNKMEEIHKCNLQAKLFQKAPQQSERKRGSALINPQTTQSSTERTVSDTVKPEKTIIKEETSAVPLGPKRRIPRPTAMLRPKLIGKSVEGSAMQAVTASRLRASSRPNPPQRTVSGSGKSPSVSSGALRDKERHKAKKRESITKAKDVTKASNSRVQPPTLKFLRDLTILVKVPSWNVARKKMNQSTIQNMFHTFLRSVQHKESDQKSISARVLSCCYGNYIGSWSAEQLKSDSKEESGLSCFHHIVNKLITKNAFHLGMSGSQLGSVQPSSFAFLMKDIVSCTRYNAAVLMQLSTSWNTRKSVYDISCRGWLIISSNPSETNMPLRVHARQNSVEREIAAIEALLDNFANQLNLDSEVLNFAGHRLSSIAKKMQVASNDSMPTASLLRCTMSRFQETLRNEGVEYHLQRRFLCPKAFLQDLPESSYKQSTICAFLERNCKVYHLLECRGTGGPCFSGSLRVVGFVVHFFITWHESVESAFDIFILTESKGQRLDFYVGKEGSPYAEKLSHVILFSSMTYIQETLRKAAMDQRKRHIWSSFGANYSSSVHAADVIEMIETSWKVELNSIDQRVELFLCDTSNELNISWQDFFSQIDQSQHYAHCIKFSSEGSTHYVVYVKNQDIFLSFKQRNHAFIFEEFHVLVLDKGIADSINLSAVVEEFISYASRWIFLSCQQFKVQ